MKKPDKNSAAYEGGFLAGVSALDSGRYMARECLAQMPALYRDSMGSPVNKQEARDFIAGWKDSYDPA